RRRRVRLPDRHRRLPGAAQRRRAVLQADDGHLAGPDLMSLPMLILGVSLCVALAMALGWALQRRLGNGGWADVVWSFATGAAGVAYALTPTDGWRPGPRAFLVALLIAGWSLRLGAHLWRRATGAAREDARYAAFRAEWGA